MYDELNYTEIKTKGYQCVSTASLQNTMTSEAARHRSLTSGM